MADDPIIGEGTPSAEAQPDPQPEPEPGPPTDVGPGVEALRDEDQAPYAVEAPADTATVPESAPTPDRFAEVLDAVASARAVGERIERALGDVQNLIDRERRAEAAREKVIDRLHAELQEYKQDLLLNTLRPVFIDLIQLHDDIGKVAALPADPDPADPGAKKWVDLLLGFQQGIEDVLYRQGVEPFQVEGDAFDPRRQRAVSTLPADDPAQVKSVAARHRKGFRAGDRVIRPEIVSVYAARKP